MDLVIPYKKVDADDVSLRFAIRSAAVYLPTFSRLIIVGDKPTAIEPHRLISVTDRPEGRWKERNIFVKIATACMDDEVSEDFIFMNDDHFLLFEYKDIPYFYQTLFGGNTAYQHTVRNTWRVLGPGCKNFDVHYPMIINKQKFLSTVAKLDWTVPFGYGLKSCYCQMNNIIGIHYTDTKVREPFTDYNKLVSYLSIQNWFSIDDDALNDLMITMLNRLYRYPTKYEIS